MEEFISDVLRRHHGKPVSLNHLAKELRFDREKARGWLYRHSEGGSTDTPHYRGGKISTYFYCIST